MYESDSKLDITRGDAYEIFQQFTNSSILGSIFVLQSFLKTAQLSQEMVYLIYFGFLPIFLMFVEKTRAPSHIIKNHYGMER